MNKNYDYILGQNSYDCGIASIITVLMYYGYRPSREEILNKIGKKQTGYSAYDLIKIAKFYNIKGIGIKENIINIKKLPAIAHTIKDKNMFHFIVIFEINNRKKTIKIMDPSEGIRIITFEEFKKITTNIFILFEGNKNSNKKKTRFKEEIIKLLKENKTIIIKTIFLSIMYVFISLIFNYYLKITLTYNKNLNILFKTLIVFIFLSIIKNIVNYIKNNLTLNLSTKMDYKITKRVTNHIFNLPYKYFINKTTGELVTTIEDIENFKQAVTQVFILSAVNLILILIIVIYLFFLNKYISISIILIVLILILVTSKFKYSFNNNFIKLKNSKIRYSSSLISYFTSFETIKNLNINKKISNILSSEYLKTLENNKKYQKKYYHYNLIITLLTDVFYLLTIYLSFHIYLTNNLNLFDIVLFSQVYYLVIELINNINESILLYKVYETSTNRVIDTLYIKEEKQKGTNLSKINSIEFKNISYDVNNVNILKNINLFLKKGDKVFITGNSGIGKSTLIKLLLQYITPKSGSIFIDNLNINDLDLSFIRENITYIGQNETIYTGSILDNFKLVSNEIEKINKISKITLLDKFLEKNNIDYNFFIEESGYNLSGGERKKIILTRGLLHLKNVLVLDEVFNEISVNEEKQILKNIFNEYNDKIVIVISHRNNNKNLFNKKYKIERDGLLNEIK